MSDIPSATPENNPIPQGTLPCGGSFEQNTTPENDTVCTPPSQEQQEQEDVLEFLRWQVETPLGRVLETLASLGTIRPNDYDIEAIFEYDPATGDWLLSQYVDGVGFVDAPASKSQSEEDRAEREGSESGNPDELSAPLPELPPTPTASSRAYTPMSLCAPSSYEDPAEILNEVSNDSNLLEGFADSASSTSTVKPAIHLDSPNDPGVVTRSTSQIRVLVTLRNGAGDNRDLSSVYIVENSTIPTATPSDSYAQDKDQSQIPLETLLMQLKEAKAARIHAKEKDTELEKRHAEAMAKLVHALAENQLTEDLEEAQKLQRKNNKRELEIEEIEVAFKKLKPE